MDEHYRQILISLRCDVSLIRDSSFSTVREAAARMLDMIDAELSSPAKIKPDGETDPTRIPSSILLREIAKRMQAIRRVRKFCSQCKNNPARARGLCVRCYKKAYRRGEIKRG